MGAAAESLLAGAGIAVELLQETNFRAVDSRLVRLPGCTTSPAFAF